MVCVHIYVCEYINCECRKNLQIAINRYSQLKPVLRYATLLIVHLYLYNVVHNNMIGTKGTISQAAIISRPLEPQASD